MNGFAVLIFSPVLPVLLIFIILIGMNITIFGYPKTGKTSLFNLLTGANIEFEGSSTGKKEINVRSCPVPDTRLDKLWNLYSEKQKKPVPIDFIDLAGISYGGIKNEAYLSQLRKADGLTHVVREFFDVQIPHFKDKIDPGEDIQSMEEELILSDLFQVESRMEKLEKELKRTKNSDGEKEKDLLERIRNNLENGKAIRELNTSTTDDKLLRTFAFLSQKALLHMINVDEKDIQLIKSPEKIYSSIKERTAVMAFCGKIEMEILELEDEEKNSFLTEYGLEELSAPKFLNISYELLDIITFFTIGREELKAWTIKKNTTALSAAGLIHSDIEKGFIKAEIIAVEELLKYKSIQTAKENAAVRLEGKDYIIQDGDVIYFRFAK